MPLSRSEIHAVKRRGAREGGQTRITTLKGVDDQRDRGVRAQPTQRERAEEVDQVPEHDGLFDQAAAGEATDPSLQAGIVAHDFLGDRVEAFTGLHGVDHCLGAHEEEGGERVGELHDTDGTDDADEGGEVGDDGADDEG